MMSVGFLSVPAGISFSLGLRCMARIRSNEFRFLSAYRKAVQGDDLQMGFVPFKSRQRSNADVYALKNECEPYSSGPHKKGENKNEKTKTKNSC